MSEYREAIPNPEDSDNETNNETVTQDLTITQSNSSLSPSFLNEFNNLRLTEERINRYANEISSESRPSTSTSTTLNDIPLALPAASSTSTVDREGESSSDLSKLMKRRERAMSKAIANIKRSMEVDLCYVLDCTGSMAGHIAAAKDCILQVTEHIQNINPCIKIRVGFCGYRDHCDGVSRLHIFKFGDSYEEFKKELSKVPATGGGDGPEDVLGGLDAAISQMNWNNGTRVLFHIGDYPPHGRRFTDMHDDEYPDGDPNGLTAESVLEKMKLERILYFFGKITNYTDKMIEVFRGILGEVPVFDLVGGGDPIELINKFVKATTSSITISVSLTSSLGARDSDVYSFQQRSIDINPEVPDWNALPAQRGVTLGYPIPKTQEELRDRRYFKKERLFSRNFYFKIAQQPFSSGVEKYAYFSIDTKKDPPKKMVMKEYFKNDSHNPFEKYLEAVEISSVASFLSIRFNSVARRKNIQSVNFLEVKLVRAVIDNKTRYYISEPELKGANFMRFNVNSGVIVELRYTLEAFSHFTYWYTEGYLVVSDLQGIELTDQFLLTDPAIHCTDPLRFGRTNLGKRGIDDCFLKNHRCNEICEKLGIMVNG
ncbi:17402_t:CDS:2 [Acaulospora morrowiae]|uniref:17402_t:CDS:1 n=1 Tax=Acaulospora morrowiae TaxID=94023 RepID=A0A9N8V9X4_9GLOM|nr:17402_t:CDS:2 [Acaulospora morrowiae]